MGEDEKILQTLATLEDEHRSLDMMISGEAALNSMQVQRMKKRKLWLRDQIAHLHSILHPDIIA